MLFRLSTASPADSEGNLCEGNHDFGKGARQRNDLGRNRNTPPIAPMRISPTITTAELNKVPPFHPLTPARMFRVARDLRRFTSADLFIAPRTGVLRWDVSSASSKQTTDAIGHEPSHRLHLWRAEYRRSRLIRAL
jgi:hypothetical protein